MITGHLLIPGLGLAQLAFDTVPNRDLMHASRNRPLQIALVAPSMGILGGQAVQADRLLRAWNGDPDVRAWLVPINPIPPGFLRRAVEVKYLRTIATQLTYWPLLLRELLHVVPATRLHGIEVQHIERINRLRREPRRCH